MEIYLDLVVFLNFLVDFLLLMGTNRLAGFPCNIKRTAAAAALGAVYSGSCLLSGFRFLGNGLWRIVSLMLMAGIAFGWNRSTLRRSGVFIILSMALGGIALRINRNDFSTLILSAMALYALCYVAFGKRIGERGYVPLEIQYQDNTVRLLALQDSGNTLRDPVTQQQVLIISMEAARKLTGLSEKQLKDPLQTMLCRPLPGLQLIPYKAVGQPGGMLLAMRFKNVKIGSRWQSAVVAFDTGGLGRGDVYQALTGGIA